MIGQRSSPRRGLFRPLLVVAIVGSFPLIPASATAADGGFDWGVAAGEVTDNSAKLWTRSPQKGPLQLAYYEGGPAGAAITPVKANRSHDQTVSESIKGLDPGTRYSYRFCIEGKQTVCSQTGHFTTAPSAKANETITFAVSGDADATALPGEEQPFFGTYDVFKAMRREKNDFNVFMGDTIYSDSEVAGVDPARSRKEKWAKYRLGLEQKNLRKLRSSTALYSHWDDHEFINDFSIPEHGEQLYAAGVDAFLDYAPVTISDENGLYRSFRWGRNLEVFFLDQRSFRDAKASAGGVCDNPATGAPDLAPTAPDSKRALFALLIPSLSEPVSQACKDTINDPDRTLLGRSQLKRFVAEVDASDARWKLVMNETPIQQFYGLPYDRWEGYAHERLQLLNSLEKGGVDDAVFVTTDTHANFANIVRKRTFADDVAPTNAPAEPTDTPLFDFVTGPVATNTFWDEIDAITGSPGNGELLSQAFFKPPPPDGVGMLCAQGDVFSYTQITVSKAGVEVAYKDQNGDPIIDADGTPCGPYTVAR